MHINTGTLNTTVHGYEYFIVEIAKRVTTIELCKWCACYPGNALQTSVCARAHTHRTGWPCQGHHQNIWAPKPTFLAISLRGKPYKRPQLLMTTTPCNKHCCSQYACTPLLPRCLHVPYSAGFFQLKTEAQA